MKTLNDILFLIDDIQNDGKIKDIELTESSDEMLTLLRRIVKEWEKDNSQLK